MIRYSGIFLIMRYFRYSEHKTMYIVIQSPIFNRGYHLQIFASNHLFFKDMNI